MSAKWKYMPTKDCLNIFVSSRIEECSKERSVVGRAIKSLKHEPIIFEKVGARPYPARHLYLSRLRDSQLMIAIYRSGYGYIDTAGGMEISGIEDEFEFAVNNKIDALFYVHSNKIDREQRLSELIAKVSACASISFYEDPEELFERVQLDITAYLTSKVLQQEKLQAVLEDNAADLLLRLSKGGSKLLWRDQLVSSILHASSLSPVLCVFGPAGIGKTIVAAQVAQAVKACFIRAENLAPRELFNVCAAALSPGQDFVAQQTLPDARQALLKSWSSAEHVLLVLDDCEYVAELLYTLDVSGTPHPQKKIIFTSVNKSSTYLNVEVPPFSSEEVCELVGVGGEFLQRNTFRVDDNQQVLQQSVPLSGKLLEISASHSVTSREILAYLSLTPAPLSAEHLLKLVGDDRYSVEQLYADIGCLGQSIDDGPRGFRLFDSKQIEALRLQVSRTPQRLKFYVNRLAALFESIGDFRLAYDVATLQGDGHEKHFAMAALRQSTQLGDWRLGIRIANQLLSEALNVEHKAEAFSLMLSMVYPLELMGEASRASQFLVKAKELAIQIGATALAQVEEVELASRARRTLSGSDVEGLEAVYARYGELELPWDQARLGVELSALYLHAKAYERAVDILRPSITIFKELGDEYGVETAEKNLVSALTALPGHDAEAESLLHSLSMKCEQEVDSRRQRAWLCNILTRKLRNADRHGEAEALAKEAIEIAESLGDETLRATNLVNLGNIYSDLERVDEALATYDAAAISAKKCGRRDIEADASRFQARVLCQLPVVYKGHRDRYERAVFLSQYAAGLLTGSIYFGAKAHVQVTLGHAYCEIGDTSKAVRSYFDAAQEYSHVPDDGDFAWALLKASDLALPGFVEDYLVGMSSVFGVTQANESSLTDQFVALIRPMVSTVPHAALVRLLGVHLATIRSNLPPYFMPPLVEAVLNEFQWAIGDGKSVGSYRVLHAALVLVCLLKDDSRPFLRSKLAHQISKAVDGLYARDVSADEIVWTVVLKLNRSVVVTIAPLDDAPTTVFATFILAFFIKAFEDDLLRELVPNPNTDELFVNVCSHSEIPEDFKLLLDSTLRTGEILSEQSCVVTRPTFYADDTPTCVVLSPKFLDEMVFGEGVGGSLQLLCGLTLVELVFQLLQGEVETEELRPKIVSLIRKTLS